MELQKKKKKPKKKIDISALEADIEKLAAVEGSGQTNSTIVVGATAEESFVYLQWKVFPLANTD